MVELGRPLLVLGAVLILIGLAFTFSDRIPFLGRLPGDIVIQREGLTCAVPIATSILLSLLLTVVLNVIARLGNR
jgi:hypothetical protein